MTRQSRAGRVRSFPIAVLAGLLFAPYLYVVNFAIPIGFPKPGHYNVGNVLVQVLFFSYAPLTLMFAVWTGIGMYVVYAYVALERMRRAGLILFALHYGFAGFVMIPYMLYRSPGLLDDTRLQMAKLLHMPGTMLAVFGPFIFANLWYLVRLLVPAADRRYES
jgi:hypothetical protein